jgi:hypothetical protein
MSEISRAINSMVREASQQKRASTLETSNKARNTAMEYSYGKMELAIEVVTKRTFARVKVSTCRRPVRCSVPSQNRDYIVVNC